MYVYACWPIRTNTPNHPSAEGFVRPAQNELGWKERALYPRLDGAVFGAHVANIDQNKFIVERL